jgi:hypothetical protein
MDNLDSLSSYNTEQMQNYIESFLKLCYELLEEKNFLCYYEEKFNLCEQIELVFEMSGNRM